jgi:hypothetical protein
MNCFASLRARLPLLPILCVALSCGTVTSIQLLDASPPCREGFCGAIIGTPVKIAVGGRGACSTFKVDFGDGTSTLVNGIDFGQSGTGLASVQHIYSMWAGKKTIKAQGITNCGGSASQLIHVAHAGPPIKETDLIGVTAPGWTGCTTPGFTVLKNSKISVTSPVNDPAVFINFGCPFGQCNHDADGVPNSSAGGTYPFPGKRELSLVFRVGSKTFQGGTNESFVTTQAGPLEFCVNDYNTSDNTGAWRIVISVDESAAL